MTSASRANAAEPARQRNGISIKLLSVILFIAAIATIAFLLFELSRSTSNAQALYDLERERSKCDGAIQQFMDGSDYLTRQIQQYVVKGERSYMDSYWTEVYQTKSRDKAVEAILSTDITPGEREAVISGKAESDSLIKGEIWAMRMVSEGVGIAVGDMPKDVADFSLEPSDANLTAQEKRSAAIAYVFGPDYSMSKSVIRDNVNTFRAEITNRYAERAISALDKTRRMSTYMSLTLIVFLVVFIAAIVCFTSQVVSPVVGFAHMLSGRDKSMSVTLSENGASEIRQFAKAFNSLSSQVELNTKRLEKMGYIDYLTCVPNRASVTEHVSGLIAAKKAPLGILMVDIDNFKKFNDTYGHALGDKVLCRVARAVCACRPADIGIAGRLCGEEFVVAIPGADGEELRLTAEDILQSVRDIKATDVDMPEIEDFHITVSAGGMIWRGESPACFERLLGCADKALYFSKKTGKDKYTFVGDMPECEG